MSFDTVVSLAFFLLFSLVVIKLLILPHSRWLKAEYLLASYILVEITNIMSGLGLIETVVSLATLGIAIIILRNRLKSRPNC